MVVCDDVYNLLYFSSEDGSTPNLKRLFAYDDKYVRKIHYWLLHLATPFLDLPCKENQMTLGMT